jgi:pilus assembly protein Flp/PilA
MTGLAMELADNLRRFVGDESGATAIEYAVMAAGIAVAVAATVMNLGTNVKTQLFDRLSTLF